MKKTTNLEKAKDVARTLLYVDIQETEFPFILVHPFFNQRYYMLGKERKLTDILASKDNLIKAQEYFLKLIDEADDIWRIFMFMHKPYRPLYFKLINDDLSKEDFAEALAYVWTDTENPNQDANVSIPQWIRYFSKADKEFIMTASEREFYDSLSDTDPIEIYRGVGHGREPYGLSWTVKSETAEWFAKRWGNKYAYMFKTYCKKSDTFAYFNGRGEDELVVNVKNLDKSKIERIDLNG